MNNLRIVPLMMMAAWIVLGVMSGVQAEPQPLVTASPLSGPLADPLTQPVPSWLGLRNSRINSEPNMTTQSGAKTKGLRLTRLMKVGAPSNLQTNFAGQATRQAFGFAYNSTNINKDAGHRLYAMPRAKLRQAIQSKPRHEVASINPSDSRSYDLNISGGNNRGKLFGTLSISTTLKKAHRRWIDLEKRTSNPMPACKGTSCFTQRWQDIVSQARSLPQRKRLLHVNRSINKLITYRSDMQAFQSRDYWASPAEAYRAGGDCEDFAIAKYWMLREIGYKPNEMRLVVLRDTMVNQWHAVLAVRHGDDWAILDNRFSRIRMSGEMPHLKPVYTVNEVGTWMQKPKTGKSLNQLVARK